MAGLYADVPGHRFAYDVDGTACLTSANGAPYTSWDPAIFNDEASDGYTIFAYREQGTKIYAFGFPEPRDIAGYYLWATTTGITTYQYTTSLDTTDGSNGTWSAPVSVNIQTAIYPQSRNAITAVSVAGVKGLRFTFATGGDWQQLVLGAIHIYGTTSPADSTDRLEFWHPTLDQQADKAAFDFGDIAQGQMITKQFRLKNLSATKTAGTVAVTANNAPGGETLLASGLTFSSDNVTYAASLNIPSIAPGAITPLLYARRTVGVTDPASIRFARVVANPGTFA